MQTIKIQCPAKINLDLKIVGKLPNNFHEIESTMQTISLYDYLTISVEDSNDNEIVINGSNNEIPYDETNLVYKAAKLFFENSNIKNKKISIYISKNIPVAAGLAGGSTDGAGTLYGLNKIFNKPLTYCEIDNLCSKLGSDLNVCLTGGKTLAKGRGEIVIPLEFEEFNVSLIKPINFGISAGKAYTKFSWKEDNNNLDGRENFKNDLEWAVIEDYPELRYIKQTYPNAVMTGSGPAYYLIDDEFSPQNGYWMKNNLHSIDFGVKEI